MVDRPFISNVNNKLKGIRYYHVLYDDLGACNQELPERWWKAQRKNTI
jgi:hypothetical protein